jgi:hemolysin D
MRNSMGIAYGYLTGKVVSVSHDAMQDEKLGLVYQARVRLDHASLNIDRTLVRLTSGMNPSVEIRPGSGGLPTISSAR